MEDSKRLKEFLIKNDIPFYNEKNVPKNSHGILTFKITNEEDLYLLYKDILNNENLFLSEKNILPKGLVPFRFLQNWLNIDKQ